MWKRTTLTLVLFGILFGIAGAAYVNDKSKAARDPASVKRKVLWMPSPAGKHLALLKVEIENSNTIPSNGDGDVTLTGRILVNQEINGDLSFSWSLPEDVTLVDGKINDSFSGTQMGQIVETSITVSGFNKEKQRLISFQASGRQKGEVLGASAVIASRPEDTWEAVAPEMKKAAEEQLQGESQTRPGR